MSHSTFFRKPLKSWFGLLGLLILAPIASMNDGISDEKVGTSQPSPEGIRLELQVELNPAGSFIARTQSLTLRGVQSKGDLIAIEEISFPVDSLRTGIELRDHHMSQKYFESRKFPIASLKSVQAKGGSFRGRLVVHGVERGVEGTYERQGPEVRARFKTSLSAFSIAQASYMGVGVEDEVEVVVFLPKVP